MRLPWRLAVLAAGVLCMAAPVAPSAQPPPRTKLPCSGPIRLAERSFLSLPSPSRYAYVWVDDIDSRFIGGFHPFQLYVLVGGTYSPFQAKSGRLDRATFDKLTKSTYDGTRIGPLTVTPANVADGTAEIKFTSAGYSCSLKILSVHPRLVSDDSLEFQMCW